MKTLKSCMAAAAMVAMTGATQAALIDRGGGMIYDTTRNITWLADMNYASTSGYASANAGGANANQILANGQMGWIAAVAWANQLVHGGFDDWRLPTLNPADTSCSNSTVDFPIQYYGRNCTGGELSGLFVTDLGYNNDGDGLIASDDTPEQIANLSLFTNVQSPFYWSGTNYAPSLFPNKWHFGTTFGITVWAPQEFAFFAVAVRPGDVTAAVPEPQTLALALLALGATVVARRRRPS